MRQDLAPRLCLPGVLSCYMLDEHRCILERGPFAGWTDLFIYGMYLVPKGALDPAIWPETQLDATSLPRLTALAKTVRWVAFSDEPKNLPYVHYDFRQQWFLGQTPALQIWTPDGTVLVDGRTAIGKIEDPDIDPSRQELSLQRLVRGLSGDKLTENEARVAAALGSFVGSPDALRDWEKRLDETFARAALHADQIRELTTALDTATGAPGTVATIATSWATVTAAFFGPVIIRESLHPDVDPPVVHLPADTIFSASGVAAWEPSVPMPARPARVSMPVPARMSTRDQVGWVAFAVVVAGLLWFLAFPHP